MKKGFTLLELVIVVIILGVLATLGLTQYGRMIERSRGAEARAILGTVRTYAMAYYMERNGSLTGFDNALGNIGTLGDQIPSACRASHYFSYGVASTATTATITATRCTTTLGKGGVGGPTGSLLLTSDMSTGADTWGGTSGY